MLFAEERCFSFRILLALHLQYGILYSFSPIFIIHYPEYHITSMPITRKKVFCGVEVDQLKCHVKSLPRSPDSSRTLNAFTPMSRVIADAVRTNMIHHLKKKNEDEKEESVFGEVPSALSSPILHCLRNESLFFGTE